MTLRDIYYAGAGSGASQAVTSITVTTLLRADNIYLQIVTAAAVANLVFYNQGWYNTGGVFETWETSGDPNTTPPSGHTLLDVGFVVLQQ